MFHSKPTFKSVAVPTANPRSIRFDSGRADGGRADGGRADGGRADGGRAEAGQIGASCNEAFVGGDRTKLPYQGGTQ